MLTLAVAACVATGGNVMGADGKLQTSIEVPMQVSTALATQRVINAAIRAGFRIESTSPAVVNLSPKDLNSEQRVMLRANIAGSESASTVVVSGNFTDAVLGGRYKPGTSGAPIGHWVGGRMENVWNEIEKFASAIRSEQ